MARNTQLLFFCFACLFIGSLFFTPYPLSWLFKIIPLLILIFSSIKLAKEKTQKYFLIGLIFSAFGDFFLDYNAVHWFIFGLGSFLVAHLFYIVSLKPISFSYLKKRLAIMVFYAVYSIAIFTLLSSKLGELFLPVFIYMSILLIMAITTLVSNKSNQWLILGGFSFVISDSLLGVNKFYAPIPQAGVLIMISYYTAQFFLAKGMFYSLHKARPKQD